ncbi:MAG: hypothetical protein INH43_13735 [Acidobacteriaceae bacterium]|nr:hypothetical protein [Acidobacteriaceae bacterium]
MRSCIFVLFCVMAAWGQNPSRLAVSATPAALRIRPHREAILQVKVYGNVPDGEKTKEVRLRQAGWSVEVVSPRGGWVSKPFRFQGTDTEPFYDPATGLAGSLFRQLSGQFTVKDAIVYHAPETPGRYTVEFRLGELRTAAEIVVDAAAPGPEEPAEKWTFGPERPMADPYRQLAEHYAPYVAQETWFDWRADAICRVDYDNDWDGGNNWDNLGAGSTQAYVYYAAIESQSHWFLIYNFFHARDYSDNCVAGTCHENDNEGVIVAVRKDGSALGRIEAMETLAHNNIYSYTAGDAGIRGGAHNVDGPLLLHNGSHPVVFLEAGGHGALGAGDKKSFFDGNNFDWKQNTGITYVYKGAAERPRHGVDREVGYELLPIYHHWWARATRESNGEERLLSAFYRYTPAGGRPGMRAETVAGSFYGVKHGRDKAKPFWGWHDVATQRRKILATGQWGADPAYGFSQNLRFPADRPVSTEYVFNPYLDVGGPEPAFVAVERNVVGQASGAGPAATASGSAPAKGSCTVEVVVDGTVGISLSGGRPVYEVLVGAPEREVSQQCTGAVSRYYSPQYRVEKVRGRGEVRLVDPAAGRIEIRDPARGADTYRFTLYWETAN